METEGPDKPLFPTDLYHQASTDILTLKSSLPQDAVASLAREVLTRLADRVSEPATRSDVVNKLCDALLADDPLAAAALIEEQFAAGVTVDALYLGYLSPAARQLGEWWNTDVIRFADVTVGTGRIYGIMRSLSRRMPRTDAPDQKAAMVACVPGETHTLGARMATDLLREQGWLVDLQLTLDHDALVAKVVESGHVIIGVSAAGEHALPALAKLVLAIRVSRPDAAIMVSGNIVDQARDRIALMGVDGMSQTFAEASAMLDEMWANATRLNAT